MEYKAILFLLFVASIFYTTASGIACDRNTCTSNEAYAVSVGVISLVFTMALLAGSLMMDIPVLVHRIAGVFLFLWWLIGACVGTFDGPFVGANFGANGYFSAWMGFVFASYYVFVSFSHVQQVASNFLRSNIVFLGFAAGSQLVYMIAAAIYVDNNGGGNSYANYAVAAGVIGLVITLALLALRIVNSETYEKVAVYPVIFLVLWWVIAFGITTFKSPFTGLTNGYFAAWASMISSGLLLAAILDKDFEQKVVEKVAGPNTGAKNSTTPGATEGEPVAEPKANVQENIVEM